MLNYYHTKDFDVLFCYFLDTYIVIQEHGPVDIPPYLFKNNESKNVCSFLNEGIQLFGQGHFPELFDILLESLFYKFYKECTELSEINKLVVIKTCIKFLFNDDFISFLNMVNMWSGDVQGYAFEKICPLLDEKKKQEYLKWSETDYPLTVTLKFGD